MNGAELRWTLLLLGVLFLAGLAWWELRRPRQARGADLARAEQDGASAPPAPRSPGAEGRGGPQTRGGLLVHREPTLTLPPIGARDPLPELPTIEVVDDSADGFTADRDGEVDLLAGELESIELEPAMPEADPLLEPRAETVEVDRMVPRPMSRGADPIAPQPAPRGTDSMVPRPMSRGIDPVAPQPVPHEADPLLDEPIEGDAADDALSGAGADGAHFTGAGGAPLAAVADVPAAGAAGAPATAPATPTAAPPATPPAGARIEPVIDWPDEGLRRIVALRLVAGAERFPGHAVRQALAAEGFVLGKLAIFHRAGPDGRAVLSAANLKRPGTFDLEAIDRQRIGGLSLFAVLPGPLPPVRAFDELLAAARNLNERLHGQLQDERGETLTPVRAAELREGLGTHTPHDG